MAVSYLAPRRVDDLSFLLRWTSDATPPIPFRVYVAGVLVSSWISANAAGEFLFHCPPTDYPFIEVLDDADAIPTIAFPGRMTLHWQSISGAGSYVIEEYDSPDWVVRDTIAEDGRGAFRWISRWLEDSTTHQFRVTPYDISGNAGTALEFSFPMARHPDAPTVGLSVNVGTRKLTFS